MIRILPLFQGFVRAHTDYFAQEYAYFHRGEAPGPLSPVYSIFRDRILLVALEEIRTEFMESMGHDTDALETLRYVMKHTTRTNGTRTPRGRRVLFLGGRVCNWTYISNRFHVTAL